LEGRIRRILDAIKAKRLLDIDPSRIESALLEMRTKRGFGGKSVELSVSTKNEYITSIKGFTHWAKKRRKLEHDPLESLSKIEESGEERRHPRRALSTEQVSDFLDAALRRPEQELLVVRRGKYKGQLQAKVRPWALAKARRIGTHRRMAYMLAIWTGLRRTELAKLEWRDVYPDLAPPFIQMRQQTAKAKRGDTIALHPQAVEELLAYRPKDAQPHDRVIPQVPSMRVLKADLAFAKIDYGNNRDGFADLHSMRMTLNMMLANAGVDSRTRQAQLRHKNPLLTEKTYFDNQNFIKP
jgi:integrase